jgi:hypothetical protein
MIWAQISPRTAQDATKTLYNISTRMAPDATMNRVHKSARTAYAMWREKRLWNVGVRQRARLFNLASSNSVNQLISVMETCVFFAVRTEFLNII